MASVFKRGKRPHVTFWVSFYALRSERRYSYCVGPDRVTAQTLADRIESLERLRISGDPLPPDTEKWVERLPASLLNKIVSADLIDGHKAAAGVTIEQHLEDFAGSLQAKGDTPKQVVQVASRCDRLLKIENALRTIANEGKRKLTSRTKGFYLASIKQFCEWAVRQGRIASNAIEHLSVKFAGDVKKRRRPLTVEEVRTLVTVTTDGPERHRISGTDRAILYAFTAETGCRAGEVAAFTAGDFDLSDELVSVLVRSNTTKNGKDRSLLISTGLSVLLCNHLGHKTSEAKAFSTPRLDAFAKMLRKDCDAAGIPTVDGAGREVDFHALRVTSASLMVTGGFDVKLAQQRLGHHDPALTLKVYAMTYRETEADAVRNMPDLTAQPTTATARATGTDNSAITNDKSAQRAAQRACNIQVRNGSSSFVMEGDDGYDVEERKPLQSLQDNVVVRDVSSPRTKATFRTRTGDLRFTKPLLYQLS